MEHTKTAATDLADRYWEFRRRTDAIRAMWRNDTTHLELMEEVGVDEVESRIATLLEYADEAAATAPTDPTDRTLAETVEFTARASAAEQEWIHDLGWVNHEVGLVGLVLTFLPRQPVGNAADADRLVEKYRNTGRMFDRLTERVGRNARTGRVPTRGAVAGTIAQIDRLLATDPSNDPLLAADLPKDATGSRDDLERALVDEIRPALARLRDVLAIQVLPTSRPADRAGMMHLPGGVEGYARLVGAHTSTQLTPEQIHRIGLEQIARLEEEYLTEAGPLLDTPDIDEIYRRLRSDPDLRYANPEAIVADASVALDRAVAATHGWFGLRPRAACVASAIEQGALAFYSGPPEDGSKPGTFFFNTSDPSAWGTFQLEAVTFHESVPGHHFQIALSQEIPHLHALHNRMYIAAYNEGWGLYTERLADEMGLYSSQLQRVGMLAADSMRACRLVVDTGMHALGWTRDEAIRYVLDHSPLSRRQAEGEIDRYIGSPGQALGYMVGRLEFDRIRREAQATLGADFSISEFHDTVLGNGTVPLATLERLVTDWTDRLRR